MKKKMVILYVFTMTMILGLVMVVMQTMGFNIFEYQTNMRLSSLAASKSTQVSSLIEQDFERTSLIASRTQMRDSLTAFENGTGNPEISRSRMIDIIKDASNSVDAIRSIEIINLNGLVVASTEEDRIGLLKKQESTFIHGMEGSAQSDFRRDSDQQPYYYLSMPLYHTSAEQKEPENVIGVLRVEMSLERMMTILGDNTGLGNTGEILLLSVESDRTICLNPLREDECDLASYEFSRNADRAMEDNGHGFITEMMGEAAFTSYNPVEMDSRQWGVLVKIDTDEVMQPYQRMCLYLAAFIMGLIVLGSAVILIGIRYSFRGVEELLKGAEEFGRGNFDHAIEVKSQDEIRTLADSYNEMAGKLKAFHDRMENLSFKDQLTGLGNRRLFEEELIRMDAPRHLPLAIVMGDVNGLKLVNDAFGHALGDELLRKVATIMLEACEKNEVLCRIGGDEFVILMPETGTKKAEKWIESIRNIFSSETVSSVNVSVSFGVASKNSPKESIQDVLRDAEEKMYGVKLLQSKMMRKTTINTIVETFLQSDENTLRHAENVSAWCRKIGEKLGFSDEKIKVLAMAGRLHDLGKIALKKKILSNADELTEKEWIEMKRHPENGYRILEGVNEYKGIAEYILSHHERWDGTGYPRKLKGEEIPVEARIIAIAEAYDVMLHHQPYRSAMTKEEAIDELQKHAGSQFDPVMVAMMTELL